MTDFFFSISKIGLQKRKAMVKTKKIDVGLLIFFGISNKMFAQFFIHIVLTHQRVGSVFNLKVVAIVLMQICAYISLQLFSISGFLRYDFIFLVLLLLAFKSLNFLYFYLFFVYLLFAFISFLFLFEITCFFC